MTTTDHVHSIERQLPDTTWMDETLYKIFHIALFDFCTAGGRWGDDTNRAVEVFTEVAQTLKKHYDPNGPIYADLETLLPFTSQYHLVGKDILHLPVPISIPEKSRFTGTYICADSDSGKTTFIEALIHNDLKRVQQGTATVMVMDSQGLHELLGRIDRAFPCTMIDTTSSFNMFALPRIPKSEREAEILYTNAVEQITAIFDGKMSEMPFTGKQKGLFNYCCQLILSAQGTIIDMYNLLNEGGLQQFKSVIPRLHPSAQDFFNRQFDDKKVYGDTRKEVIVRLNIVLSVPAFRRMFTQKNTTDIFSMLNKPQCILVNTDRALLGADGCQIFGRYIISALVLAGQQRLTLPPQYRLDTFFYCDEAGDYIATEPKLEEIIDKFRKVRIATLWAIQRERNIKDADVLDALQHCSIKFTPSSDYKFNYELKGNPKPITVFVDPVKPKPTAETVSISTRTPPRGMSRLMLKSAKRASPVINLCGFGGLGKMAVQ